MKVNYLEALQQEIETTLQQHEISTVYFHFSDLQFGSHYILSLALAAAIVPFGQSAFNPVLGSSDQEFTLEYSYTLEDRDLDFIADVDPSNHVNRAVQSCKTIAQIAEASGNFTTLVELVKAAGLLSVINVPGPLTIFAPTDAAFAKLPNATLASLKANATALAGVLSYHVVVGDVYTANMTDGETLVALNQENLTVTISGSRYFINNVPIVTPDVMACNGVIQVMGGVMLPPTPSPASSPTTPSMPSMPAGSPVMMSTGGTMGPTTAAAAGGVRVFGIWMAALFAYIVTM
jgi:uncharacterized surface protein with fasciclin (FAS1) repeats